MRPFFSVIMTSLMLSNKIRKLLDCLDKQLYNNFELIFIDQSNECKKNLLKSYSFKYQYIKVNKIGLSNARNLGIKTANGKFYFFFDDDCFFDSLFFLKVKNSLKSNIKLVGFNIKNKDKNIIVKNLRNGFIKNYFEIIISLCSSNFVIKKNKTLFDPYLGVGNITKAKSGEDTDYLLKNFTSNQFLYSNNIKIEHPVPSLNINLKKIFLYAIGQSVCLIKNKNYFILLLSILKNTLNLIAKPNKNNLIYIIGKIYGIYYYKRWKNIKLSKR